MPNNSRGPDMKTPLARLAFADGLFEMRTTENGTKQWQASLLFPKSVSKTPFEENALIAAKEEWGDKAVQMIKDGLIHNPFLDGDGPQGKSKKTGEPHAGFPGHWFIRVTAGEKYRPKLVTAKVLPVTSPEEMYSGCYVYAVINAYSWDNDKKGKGLSFGISMAQFVKEGERLGSGGGDPAEFFEVIPDQGDAPASTKSGAGAGGLFG